MTEDSAGIVRIIRRTLSDWGLPLGEPGAESGEPTDAPGRRPVALVYRGPAAAPGCPEAVAELLAASRWDFDIRYTGANGDVPLSADALAGAALYVQPGGGTLDSAYRTLRAHRAEIRRFVRDGGRYLGFCLGGYLAGATPGFDLLPGDTDQYIGSRKAGVRTDDNALVEVTWRGRRRTLFFQDGPYFWVREDSPVTVIARYDNDRIAALATEFGSGRVGVVGPHPEATQDWFDDAGLPDPGDGAADPSPARGLDVGLDLLDAVMAR